MFSLKAIGVKELIIANKKFMKRLNDGTDFENMLDEIVTLARKRCPVDKGDAVKAIRWVQLGKGRYAIVCDVKHAIYIEHGTRYFPVPDDVSSLRTYKSTSGKMASVPFMRSSIWDVEHKFNEKMFRTIDLIYLNK